MSYCAAMFRSVVVCSDVVLFLLSMACDALQHGVCEV